MNTTEPTMNKVYPEQFKRSKGDAPPGGSPMSLFTLRNHAVISSRSRSRLVANNIPLFGVTLRKIGTPGES